MEKFGKGQPVTRVEDVRFLTGQGRYVDDIAPDNAFHAVFFRAPVAHGTITRLDVSEARACEGVATILTAQDLLNAGMYISMKAELVKNRDGQRAVRTERPMLVRDRLRFVGEPVAVVVAETLAQARDAAELIELEYNELPVQLALAPGDQAIHDQIPDNRAFDWAIGDEVATDQAFARAAHTVEMEISDNRVIVNAMEPRGCFAEWENDRLHLSVNGQGVWSHKEQLCKAMGLKPDQVRVTHPDVGGGFGMKSFAYPEYFCVAQAARLLGHPVRWMSDRGEAMLTDNGGRDLVSVAALAFDENHRITGYRVRSKCNLGAHSGMFGQMIQTQLFSRVLTGVYDIPASFLEVEGYFTNTAVVDAYRGAGRPEAIYVLERMMDRAARELKVDPMALRRLNFIKPDQFPYRTVMDETYDVGDFEKVLQRAESLADLGGFPTRKSASTERGRLRGVGSCYYIESILGDPTENVRVSFNEDGSVSIFVGTQSNGQGHETVFAQFLSDQTGIPVEQITVVQGDSDQIAEGGGTGGSRSVTTQNNATLTAVGQMIEAFSAFLAEELDVAQEDVSFDDERFRVEGSNVSPSFLELAAMARDKGRSDLLTHSATAKLPARSFPNGCHIAEVEIDPETGVVTLENYRVADDFGNLINPLLAEGQVHGGVVQGIGQALNEHVVFDDEGQLLTASFMDYALPRAGGLPHIEFVSEPVPSTANALGMKGCGEAGTVGALAAVANAVQDALWERGVRQVDMPFTPHKVWELLQREAIAAE